MRPVSSQWSIPLTIALLGVGVACETTTSNAQYQRCWPTLTSEASPSSGLAGDTVTVTGRHLLSYVTGPYDQSIDLAVTVGSERAIVIEARGPYDLEEGACDACALCVASELQGCLGCEEECEMCLTDVDFQAPAGEGTVHVTLFNSMGESNPVEFTYLDDGAGTPGGTATPTETAATPTADATTTETATPTAGAPPSPSP